MMDYKNFENLTAMTIRGILVSHKKLNNEKSDYFLFSNNNYIKIIVTKALDYELRKHCGEFISIDDYWRNKNEFVLHDFIVVSDDVLIINDDIDFHDNLIIKRSIRNHGFLEYDDIGA